MNTIYIEASTITLHSSFSSRVISLPAYGIENDTITNYETFTNSIKRLISKAEEILNSVISNVHMVCNIGNFTFHKQPRFQPFHYETGKVVTCKFEMQTCNAFEVYEEVQLKNIVNIFANIGIVVEKIHSPFGVFINNARQIIQNEKIAIINFMQGQTLCLLFDGAGSITQFTKNDFGTAKCIEYITRAAIARFPYLNQNPEAISLTLQNFVNLSEFEMIQKISQNKQYKKDVISLVNYEMARFISEKMHKYCQEMWNIINIPQACNKVLITSNTQYTQTFTIMCNLLATQQILPLNSFLKVTEKHKIQNSLWAEIKSLLKSA